MCTRVSNVCTIFGLRKEAQANNDNYVLSKGHVNGSIHDYRACWGRITRYIVLFFIWKDTLESSGAIIVNTSYGPAGPCYTLQCRSPTWLKSSKFANKSFYFVNIKTPHFTPPFITIIFKSPPVKISFLWTTHGAIITGYDTVTHHRFDYLTNCITTVFVPCSEHSNRANALPTHIMRIVNIGASRGRDIYICTCVGIRNGDACGFLKAKPPKLCPSRQEYVDLPSISHRGR